MGNNGLSNFGTLRASNTATLSIADSFVNQGLIDAATNSLVDVNAILTNGVSGTITGNGRVESNGGVSNLGEIAPAGVLTLDLNGGSLLLETTSLFSIELSSNMQFDQLLVTDGRTVLGGTLEISLVENFVPSSSDVFTFLTSPFAAASFGQFANAGQNGTIMTQDGSGSFTVTYIEVIAAGSDRVQLSNFQIVPEPSTACLALAGLIGIISRRHRQPAR